MTTVAARVDPRVQANRSCVGSRPRTAFIVFPRDWKQHTTSPSDKVSPRNPASRPSATKRFVMSVFPPTQYGNQLPVSAVPPNHHASKLLTNRSISCLLYTSDAADE